MRIKNLRRVQHDPSPGGYRTLARFDLEPCEGVLLYDHTLVQAPDGRLRIYAPTKSGGAPTSSLAPDVRRQVILMAATAAGIDTHESKRTA